MTETTEKTSEEKLQDKITELQQRLDEANKLGLYWQAEAEALMEVDE